MVMSDEKIRKKLRKLIGDSYIDENRINYLIEKLDKYFPDVTIKCNGNNLLHYIAEYYGTYGTNNSYYYVVNELIKRGLNIVEKNGNGKDFLQIICEKNSDYLRGLICLEDFFMKRFHNDVIINNRDDDGNSIMQIILNSFKNQKILLNDSKKRLILPSDVKEIEKQFGIIRHIFQLLVNTRYDQISITNGQEKNIFELADSIQLKYEEKFGLTLDTTWKKDLMAIYYRKNPVDFATLYFTDDRNDNLSKVKDYLQLSSQSLKKSDILFVCQDCRRPMPEKVNAVEKYLQLGFDPNYKIDGYTFVEYAIKNNLYFPYVINITKLAIQYGLDLNNCDILEIMVKGKYNVDEISIIKILIEQNGGKKDNNFLNVRIQSFFNIVTKLARNNNMKLESEELLNHEFIKFFFEIVDCYSFKNDLENDYDFIERTIMQIKEDRDNSVALNNSPITQLEVLNALRTLVTKRTEEKFNKFLVKNNN